MNSVKRRTGENGWKNEGISDFSLSCGSVTKLLGVFSKGKKNLTNQTKPAHFGEEHFGSFAFGEFPWVRRQENAF